MTDSEARAMEIVASQYSMLMQLPWYQLNRSQAFKLAIKLAVNQTGLGYNHVVQLYNAERETRAKRIALNSAKSKGQQTLDL